MLLDYFKSLISKVVGVIYGLLLMKILSWFLTDTEFSDYYIVYNICFYVYVLLYTIQGSAILRYYYIKGEEEILHFVGMLNTLAAVINFFAFIVLYIFTNFEIIRLLPMFVFIQAFGLFNNRINFLRIIHAFDRVLILLIFQAVLSIMGVYLLRLYLTFEMVFLIVGFSFLIPSIFLGREGDRICYCIPKSDIMLRYIDVIHYAIPIGFVSFATSIMSSIDQIILRYHVATGDLSAYIANYTIAEKSVVFVLSVITLVFVPNVFKKHDSLSTQVFVDIGRTLVIFVIISIVILILLFIYSQQIVMLLTNDEFVEYAWILPYIALGGLFLGFNSIVSEVFTVGRKSMTLMYCYISGMLVNLILNLVLVPQFGISGAVFSTIGTYIILSLITLALAYNEYKNLENKDGIYA